MSVPALTVNKVGLSGLNAIAMADQLIGYGEFDIVVAGGMESMPTARTYSRGPAEGTGTATPPLIDATAHDALFCSFDQRGMPACTDYCNKARKIAVKSFRWDLYLFLERSALVGPYRDPQTL